MNQPALPSTDLLALVDPASVRLVRLAEPESRTLVRIPLGPALTVAVAARIADALLDAEPADRVLVLPRDADSLDTARAFATELDARHPGDRAVVLPDARTLASLVPIEPAETSTRRVLPRPGATPRTVRFYSTPRL